MTTTSSSTTAASCRGSTDRSELHLDLIPFYGHVDPAVYDKRRLKSINTTMGNNLDVALGGGGGSRYYSINEATLRCPRRASNDRSPSPIPALCSSANISPWQRFLMRQQRLQKKSSEALIAIQTPVLANLSKTVSMGLAVSQQNQAEKAAAELTDCKTSARIKNSNSYPPWIYLLPTDEHPIQPNTSEVENSRKEDPEMCLYCNCSAHLKETWL